MKLVRTSEEAFYAVGDGEPIHICNADIEALKAIVHGCARKRVRICTHSNVDDALHEMFVCYTKETQIAPHKHVGKDETFYVMEGEMDFILYNDSADVKKIIRMGSAQSGLPFCIRVPRDTYHKVVLHSEYCLLHEATPGPFLREDTVWANW